MYLAVNVVALRALGLAAGSLVVLRRRDGATHPAGERGFRTPGHPWTTLAFIAVSMLVVVNTVHRFPAESLIGLGILLAGLPAYLLWHRPRRPRGAAG